MSIGHDIIGEIIKQGMFATHDSDGPIQRALLHVWSSGAAEQLEALVASHCKLQGQEIEVLRGALETIRDNGLDARQCQIAASIALR